MARKAIACPPLGVSVFTGILAQWYVKVGDQVAVEQPIWSVETDKVTQDVLSSMAGTLAEIVVPEGEVVEPEMVVGYLETDASVAAGPAPEAKPAPEKKAEPASEAKAEPAPEKEAEPAPEPAAANAEPAAAKAAPAPAKAAVAPVKITPPPAAPPGGNGKSAPADSPAKAAATAGSAPATAAVAAPSAPSKGESNGHAAGGDGERPHRYSPRVRRLIRENQLSENELETIAGSGRSGRLQAADVERFVASGRRAERAATVATLAAQYVPLPSTAPAAAPAAPRTPSAPVQPIPAIGGVMEEAVETQKLTTIRKTIATYLRQSVDNAVHTVSTDECDVTDLLAMRTRLNEHFEATYGLKVAFTAFIVRAVALTLREFPLLNSQLDLEHDQVRTFKHIHIGVAVDAPQGLTVPVIRFADQLSLLQLQEAIQTVADKVRAGKATLADLQGSTYTVTNAGAIGSIMSTPIINYPNVGIIGVHKIRKLPVVRDGAIVIREMVNFSAAFDHRLVDGVYNVRFMGRVIKYLESPELLLL